MNLFLDEKTKEAKSKDYLLATIGDKDLTTPAQNTMTDYLAGWNECEKHVRESVSESFREYEKEYWDKEGVGGKTYREWTDQNHIEMATSYQRRAYEAAKASSLVEIEQLKAENERLKLHDIPGYQEGIEELKAQIKERDEALIEIFQRLHYQVEECTTGTIPKRGGGEVLRKHQSLIDKIKESRK